MLSIEDSSHAFTTYLKNLGLIFKRDETGQCDSAQVFAQSLWQARSNFNSIGDQSKNEQYLAEALLVYLGTIMQTSLSDFCFNVVRNFAARFDTKDLPRPIAVTWLHTKHLIPKQIPIQKKQRGPSFNNKDLDGRLQKYDLNDHIQIATKLKKGIAKK